MRITQRPLQTVAAALLVLVAGCASVEPGPPALAPEPAPAAPLPGLQSPPRPAETIGTPFVCDDGLTVHVRFGEGSVTLFGLPEGDQVLLRDAGGVTPEETVWSNERLRAQFGLPPSGQGAVLHVLEPQPSTLHCRRR